MDYKIVEHSFLARVARFFFGTKRIAMVLGNAIHLSGVERQIFLSDRKWLVHELVHVEQYRKYGLVKFLWLYTLESIRHGYYANKFEMEARAAEETMSLSSTAMASSNIR
jgi:hypothetical protein